METLQQLKEKAAIIQAKLDRLTGHRDITDRIAASFHLGRVGGSGRNIHRLNRQRERSIDKTVSNAVEVCALRRQIEAITAQIKDIESNGPERRAKRQEEIAEAAVKYWNSLQPGDSLKLGNGETIVKKKSKKSFTCTCGIKWTAAEIIGKAAASKI